MNGKKQKPSLESIKHAWWRKTALNKGGLDEAWLKAALGEIKAAAAGPQGLAFSEKRYALDFFLGAALSGAASILVFLSSGMYYERSYQNETSLASMLRSGPLSSFVSNQQ